MSRYRSDEEKWSCVALHKYAGWPNIQIQNALGLPQSTVSDNLKSMTPLEQSRISLEIQEESLAKLAAGSRGDNEYDYGGTKYHWQSYH